MVAGHIADETGHEKTLGLDATVSYKDETDEKRGSLPLHQWQDKNVPLAQQIVLDSHKTSLMLQNDCQADKCEV